MSEKRAVDAIWKTEIHSSQEKLVLYFLTAKHALGDQASSSWKELSLFINDFEEKWVLEKDLSAGTQLTEIKLKRVVKDLEETGYIAKTKKPKKFGKRKKFAENELIPHEFYYAITPKIFREYQSGAKTLSRSA